MSLSPFDSFQSRFVTCLLNLPHNITLTGNIQRTRIKRGVTHRSRYRLHLLCEITIRQHTVMRQKGPIYHQNYIFLKET